MKPTLPSVKKVDEQMIRAFWDAEFIVREHRTTKYSVFPCEPQDAAIAGTIGATIVPQVKECILVWVNITEET